MKRLSLGLLLLRVGFGGSMIYGHGWDKLINFSARMESFPDPFHIGSPVSLALVVFAELFCSVFVVAGLATKFAVVPLIINMSVALLFVHFNDPFAKQELATLYLLSAVILLLTGPGQYSIDGAFLKKPH